MLLRRHLTIESLILIRAWGETNQFLKLITDLLGPLSNVVIRRTTSSFDRGGDVLCFGLDRLLTLLSYLQQLIVSHIELLRFLNGLEVSLAFIQH